MPGGRGKLHPIEASALHARRERVFLVFAGLFLGSVTMLNILGVTRFIDMSFSIFGFQIPFVLAIGVLPYPVTFLCTDFISELYGRRRASFVVWVGLMLNLWVIFILWLGGRRPVWVVLPIFSLPMALSLTRLIWKGAAGAVLNQVLARTAKLALIYSLLLSIGLVLS